MFIGIRIGPRLAAGFVVVLLALCAIWGVAAYEISSTIVLLSGGDGGGIASPLRRLSDLQEALVVVHAIGAAALVLAAVSVWLLARSITTPLGKAVGALEAVARGDLTHAAAVHSRDEIGRLFGAIHGMRQGLGALVREVVASAETVAHGNAQIAQGHADLAQRTEEQAGTLEQAAAAMEELAATVGRNAASAREASELAQGASAVAHDAGEVVDRVLATMSSVSEDSRRISGILAVIDGIAFQTNILALNAAVEAARAGAQGRGFAVVAAEVRNLAQRSAAAARDIHALVDAAADKRERGSQLAQQAGATMQQVVASVTAVSGLVADIARASQDQSDGIAQVSAGVAEMERVVQQNAAMVEEAASATDAMQERAQQLLEMVSRFRLARAAELAGAHEAPPVQASPAAYLTA